MAVIPPKVWNACRVVSVGDSITNPAIEILFGATQYNAWWTPLVQHPKSSLLLPNATYPDVPILPSQIVTVGRSAPSPSPGGGTPRTGINVDWHYRTYPSQISTVILSAANRIEHLGLLPDLLIVHATVNDVTIGPVPPATTRANFDAYLGAVRAAMPNLPIVVVPVFCSGERWAAGPNRLIDNEPGITNTNAQVQASAATFDCEFVGDLRTKLLEFEMSVQPIPAASVDRGFATGDGVHPNLMAGKRLLSETVFGHLIVV